MAAEKQIDNKNYNKVFDKINKDKRERIIEIILDEFSTHGYSATNINNIAVRADISIGSLYRYFDSKENLFLSIVDILHDELENSMNRILISEKPFYDKIEDLFAGCQQRTEYLIQLNHIYLDLSTEGLSGLAQKISMKVEKLSSTIYHTMIDEAKKTGEVDPGVDTNYAAFFIDNMVMMFHFSYTTDYYISRMKIFLRKNVINDKKILKSQVDFIKNAISPHKNQH